MSLMTCSFSTTCLLSRVNDLKRVVLPSANKQQVMSVLDNVPFDGVLLQPFKRLCIDDHVTNQAIGCCAALLGQTVGQRRQNPAQVVRNEKQRAVKYIHLKNFRETEFVSDAEIALKNCD
jgi:hypothetical protein